MINPKKKAATYIVELYKTQESQGRKGNFREYWVLKSSNKYEEEPQFYVTNATTSLTFAVKHADTTTQNRVPFTMFLEHLYNNTKAPKNEFGGLVIYQLCKINPSSWDRNLGIELAVGIKLNYYLA